MSATTRTGASVRPFARRAASVALLGATALAGAALPAHAVEAPDATVPTTSPTRTTTQAQQAVPEQAEGDRKGRNKGGKDKDDAKRKSRFERVDDRVMSAVRTAMAQRGDAYSYGSAGPNAFDCSGLVYYSYRRAGFSVPRTSSAQAGAVRHIAKSRMRAGDLMFFTSGSGVYHAAIFLRWERGAAVMVHAPGSGSSVQVATPWTSSWFAGTLRPSGSGLRRA